MNYLNDLLNILNQKFNNEINWTDVSEFEHKNGREINEGTAYRYSVYLQQFLKAGWKLVPPDNNSIEVLSDIQKPPSTEYNSKDNTYTRTKMISIKEGEIITPELIMEKHQIDPELWDVVTYKNNYWNSQKQGGELITLFQSKLTVKPKSKLDFNLNQVKKNLENYIPEYATKKTSRVYNDLGDELLVPCFFDVHFSKLAHASETGEHYDYKIAKDRFIRSAQAYIDRLSGRKFEKILFIVGNDYFNSEANAETAHGTRVDNDTRATKLFERGTEALIEVINMFAEIAPVDVMLISGNHDTMTSFYCSCVLNAFYKNDENITVDNSPMLRKYYKYGSNLIGLTHGSEEKDRIYSLMQVEAASDWGTTTTHEWLIGHLHSEGVTEKNGVTVRRIPSLCGTDAWHFSQGYTMAKKQSCAFIYNKEHGLTDVLYQGI